MVFPLSRDRLRPHGEKTSKVYSDGIADVSKHSMRIRVRVSALKNADMAVKLDAHWPRGILLR
jgi:hypothetical protein